MRGVRRERARRARGGRRGPEPGMRRSGFISPPQRPQGFAGSAEENRLQRASPHWVQQTACSRIERMASMGVDLPCRIS